MNHWDQQHGLPSSVEELVPSLIEDWGMGTMFTSSVTSVREHPTFRLIVDLGERAIQPILVYLQNSHLVGSHIFLALPELTGEDPAATTDTVPGATNAWLDWGRQRGLI